jgi:hypothetical protein
MQMLRGNLATRPFYNERLVVLLLALLGVVALAMTTFNVTQLMSLSARRSELRQEISADEQQAAKVRTDAAALQSSVDRTGLMTLAGSTRLANTLIDQRTFSWTTFFGYIEDVIPMDVRLTAVAPEIDKGKLYVTMLLVGRKADHVAAFMSGLEETGAFFDVVPVTRDRTDEGFERVSVRGEYRPTEGTIVEPPATGTGRSRPQGGGR